VEEVNIHQVALALEKKQTVAYSASTLSKTSRESEVVNDALQMPAPEHRVYAVPIYTKKDIEIE